MSLSETVQRAQALMKRSSSIPFLRTFLTLSFPSRWLGDPQSPCLRTVGSGKDLEFDEYLMVIVE